MEKTRLLKGSEEFEMFQDYWKLLQENWKTENNSGYWGKVMKDSDAFYQKYKTPFARELSIAYINELERRAENGV